MKSSCSEVLAAAASHGLPMASGLLRWLANYGLSLSAASFAMPEPEDAGSACPFVRLLEGFSRKTSA